jgi:uncharacterized protein (DUF433 family)
MEPIVKAGGESFTSFDELEQVTNTKIRQSQLEKKSENAIKAAVGAAEKEAKEDKKREAKEKEEKAEKKTDADSVSKAEAKEKKAESKEKGSDAKKAEAKSEKDSLEAKETAPPKKSWKLKYNDAELELFEDMKVPVKVDGQEIETSFSDLINGYSGQSAITKRFQEYNENKKRYEQDYTKFTTEKSTVDQFLKQVFEASKTNPVEGIIKAAEFAGLDPIEYQIQLAESMAGFSNKWLNMTDLEKQSYRLGLENQHMKSKLQKESQKTQQYEALKAVDAEVTKIQDELGITRQQFAIAYEELEQMQKAGQLKGEISPELVREHLSGKAVLAEAKSLVESTIPALSTDAAVVESVAEIMKQYNNLTKEDIADIIKESYAKRAGEKIADKVAHGKPKEVTPKQPLNAQKDLWSFDQLY